MAENHSIEISIDKRLDSYRGFLGNEIFKDVFEEKGLPEKVELCLLRLLMEIRSHSYTASLPGMLPTSIESWSRQYIQASDHSSSIGKLITKVLYRATREVPQLIRQDRLKRKVEDSLMRIASECADLNSSLLEVIDSDDVWGYLQEERVFAMSVWSSQRLVYVSVFNAYDNFLTSMVKVKLGLQSCRSTSRRFKDQLREAYGEILADSAWLKPDMKIYREVRHSLAHAAGREIDSLKGVKHKVIVQDGFLQIWPGDIKRLIQCIINEAEKLAWQHMKRT